MTKTIVFTIVMVKPKYIGVSDLAVKSVKLMCKNSVIAQH